VLGSRRPSPADTRCVHPCSHIDNVTGSDINQNDMGHDDDGVATSGSSKFGDSDDIQQVTPCSAHSERRLALHGCGACVHGGHGDVIRG
jgi:hypothetical protein